MFLVAAYVIASLVPAENAYRQLVVAVAAPLSFGLFAMSLASIIWCAWSTYALWRFEREFE